MLKTTGIILIVMLLAIQFVHLPQNEGEAFGENDIGKVVPLPESIQQILKTSCYDCHSNHTEYPWYSNIQPIGLWLSDHVNEGKKELNFSEFATYKRKRQLHKLEEIGEQLEKKEMPLKPYLIMHTNATLTLYQATQLNEWAKQRIEFIKNKVDTVVR
ncbi:MAG: heme-binding domain-containing protein [Bacteroidia bacterium]|nr:heme-binding domain-containing protein [Bacteroidia bacterium]